VPKIVITGAAGLLGQNLIVRLKRRGFTDLVGIDKHKVNTPVLAQLHPDVTVIGADLAQADGWQGSLAGASCLVIGHAQIGGDERGPFDANNVTATARVLEAAKAAGVPHIVHISSSVVNSQAVDFYVETKRAQEALVVACGIPTVVLRPTLMFGWFDRKHLGWLARFMRRIPVFPIPGNGRFRRQPLYVGDFCDVLIACIEQGRRDEVHNISGLEVVDYIDLIRDVRTASRARSVIVTIPFWLFWVLLKIYAVFDRDPPFTTKQLGALSIPELFEVIDWPGIFGVRSTKLQDALNETFREKPYCDVELAF
jgi:nucleoside-diphosphate-sugar epimerase